MLNTDFKRGFWVGAGVLVAVLVVGAATGVLRRVV